MVKPLRKNDWPFLVLVLIHLVGIAGFWRGGVGGGGGDAEGWRPIDVELIKAKIGSGDLVDHEAEWYRVLPSTRERRR